MRLISASVACLLLAGFSAAAPLAGADASPMDQAWMVPGFTLALQTSPSTSAAAAGSVSAPFAVLATIEAVTSSSVTFRWAVGGVVESATFDRASRLGPGGGSILWIGDAEVEAGRATLGDRGAVLVLSTPIFHHFAAGSQSYYFSAVTGLLIRADDLYTGSAIVTAAQGLSPPPPVLPTGPPGPASVTQRVPVAADYGVPLPTNEIERACSGLVAGLLGGAGACDAIPISTFADYDATLTIEMPLLAKGSVRATFHDSVGPFLMMDCSAHIPAAYNVPPLPNTVLCTSKLLRPSLPTGQDINIEARFSHCLSPGYGFSCPWSAHLALKGGVAT